MAAILNVTKDHAWHIMEYMLAKGIEPVKSEYVRCVSSEQVYIGR